MRATYIIVRLRPDAGLVRADGRLVGRHGLFGNLHCLPLHEALRLVDGGTAKLLPHMSEARLRRDVEAALDGAAGA